MTRVELAAIGEPDRLVKTYQNRLAAPGNPDWIAVRWWADTQLLVGGSILDLSDWKSIRDLGIRSIISAEIERADPPGTDAERRLDVHWPDDGAVSAEIFRRALRFAHEAPPAIYVHCQMGGSRSASLAYAILRSRGFEKRQILGRFREIFPQWGDHPFHQAYTAVAESVIAEGR